MEGVPPVKCIVLRCATYAIRSCTSARNRRASGAAAPAAELSKMVHTVRPAFSSTVICSARCDRKSSVYVDQYTRGVPWNRK